MRVLCDYCGKPAELVSGSMVYPHRPDLMHRRFWLCAPCDAWVGCHPARTRTQNGFGDGAHPMGRLANAELRKAKQAAHTAFDPLWKSRQMSRTEAYAWLAAAMGISKANCHIGMFDLDACRSVVAVVNARNALEAA